MKTIFNFKYGLGSTVDVDPAFRVASSLDSLRGPEAGLLRLFQLLLVAVAARPTT